MNNNMFKGRPRKDSIHDGVLSLYQNIADGNIKTYSGIIQFMKKMNSFGKISNMYKIRNQVVLNLKNIADEEWGLTVTCENIFHVKHENESVASACAKLCLNDKYYKKVISKNVTSMEYLQKLVDEQANPVDIASQMISLGIRDKKCSDFFIQYVASYQKNMIV